MKRVIVVVEGATEERFVSDVLCPELIRSQVLLSARILGKPGHKGGRVNYARVKKDVLILLKSDPTAFCTTLLDYYGLEKGFPGATGSPGGERAANIEVGMKADLIAKSDSLRADIRVIPYLQLHEYEALLFSDPQTLAKSLRVPSLAKTFAAIRNQVPTPEDINDNWETAPSKGIRRHHESYNKVIDGTTAARAITVIKMRMECPRFHRWLTILESLPDL